MEGWVDLGTSTSTVSKLRDSYRGYPPKTESVDRRPDGHAQCVMPTAYRVYDNTNWEEEVKQLNGCQRKA